MTSIGAKRNYKKKDRFGDADLKQLEKQADDSTSDSESEDSDGEAWTASHEKAFLRVYAALQTHDSKIYDDKVQWFDVNEKQEEVPKTKKQKPLLYNEYHRKYLLNSASSQDRQNKSSAINFSSSSQSLSEEMQKESESGNESVSEDDDGDDLLSKKKNESVDSDDDDEEAVIHKYLLGEQEVVEKLDPTLKTDLDVLKTTVWSSAANENDKFIRDFIAQELWRETSKPGAAAELSDSDCGLSDDERFLKDQETFEHTWNNRSELQKADLDKFERTLAAAEKDSDSDGDFVFVKPNAQPLAVPDSPLTSDEEFEGNDKVDPPFTVMPQQNEVKEKDREFDSKSFPRGVDSSLRQKGTKARQKQRLEKRAAVRAEKQETRRQLTEFVQLHRADLMEKLSRIERNSGMSQLSKFDPEELDKDFDPDEHDKLMQTVFDDNFYTGDTDQTKPEFSDAEVEEEDDKVQFRFHYRQVDSNDFGLTAEEILLADDKELNAWCSVKKMSQWRSREAEAKDRRKFHSQRMLSKKDLVLPSVSTRLKEMVPPSVVGASLPPSEKTVDLTNTTVKKRKKRKRKAAVLNSNPCTTSDVSNPPCSNSHTLVTDTKADLAVDPTNTSQQKQNKLETASSVQPSSASNNQPVVRNKKRRKPTQYNLNSKRIAIDAERLQDLGINPSLLKHKKAKRKSS